MLFKQATCWSLAASNLYASSEHNIPSHFLSIHYSFSVLLLQVSLLQDTCNKGEEEKGWMRGALGTVGAQST